MFGIIEITQLLTKKGAVKQLLHDKAPEIFNQLIGLLKTKAEYVDNGAIISTMFTPDPSDNTIVAVSLIEWVENEMTVIYTCNLSELIDMLPDNVMDLMKG